MPRATGKPDFFRKTDIVIASSYRKFFPEVQAVSKQFTVFGLKTYPHPSQEIVSNGEFVHLSGVEGYGEKDIEHFYFEAIRDSQLLYVVAQDGYIGKTAGIETAYALAIQKPVALSETIARFGEGLPEPISRILKDATLRVVPINSIENFTNNGFLELKEDCVQLDDNKKRDVFFSLISLMRELKMMEKELQNTL